jgi:hypothetical protein
LRRDGPAAAKREAVQHGREVVVRGKGRVLTLLVLAVVAVVAAATYGLDVFAEPVDIADVLPADPMIAGFSTVHPADRLDTWLERAEAILEEEVDPWAELDAKVGMSFRDDVLGAFGPDFAFALDLPYLDPEKGPEDLLSPDAPERVLNGWILAARIEDRGRALRALGALVNLAGAELGTDGDRMTVTLREPSLPGGSLVIHARVHSDLVVISGSAELVDDAIAGFEPGKRLADGEDFARVATHVAADPETLTYFNLPKIRDWIRGSGLLATPGADRVEPFLTDEWMGMGLIHTTRATDGGMEVAHFGPEATSEGLWALWTGAFLVPATLGSTITDLAKGEQRGTSRRAMDDLRVIGTALETFAVDNSRYPTTTGWESVDAIRPWLEPAYIHQLPETDPWGMPYQVWSDGQSYRIVCTGADRAMDRDWSVSVESGSSGDAAVDLVFGDGQFLRWHE